MSDTAKPEDPTTTVPETKAEETTSADAPAATEETKAEEKAEEKKEAEAEAEATKPAAAATEGGESKPVTSDSVFSMFGGGPKKEKKEEDKGDENEPSGSSKAKKEAEGGEGDVSIFYLFFFSNFLFDCSALLLHWTIGHTKKLFAFFIIAIHVLHFLHLLDCITVDVFIEKNEFHSPECIISRLTLDFYYDHRMPKPRPMSTLSPSST